jgi:hypothetical protein|tara:strand:- start:629 stop:997 length:369 start_codon:yes stop_codon:yes gene_type:complete
MAIIMRGDVPAKRQMGIGTAIKRKLAEAALVDLPIAAVKTAAGLPIFGGEGAETEQDKMLREAIEKLISEGTRDELTPTPSFMRTPTPMLMPLGGQTLPGGLGQGVQVGLMTPTLAPMPRFR